MERRSSDHDCGGKEGKGKKTEIESINGDKVEGVKWGIEWSAHRVGGP